jgi:hypothetical protein
VGTGVSGKEGILRAQTSTNSIWLYHNMHLQHSTEQYNCICMAALPSNATCQPTTAHWMVPCRNQCTDGKHLPAPKAMVQIIPGCRHHGPGPARRLPQTSVPAAQSLSQKTAVHALPCSPAVPLRGVMRLQVQRVVASTCCWQALHAADAAHHPPCTCRHQCRQVEQVAHQQQAHQQQVKMHTSN